jgi:HD-GYP domain-containing protein (c-di-GMP phosphodiesterase class II)
MALSPETGRSSVRLVRIETVADGMELARDVPAATLGSAPLLRRGVRLTTSLASRLEPRGVRAVWIEDDMGEGIVPVTPLSDDVRRSTESAVGTCLTAARTTDGGLGADAIGQLENAAVAMLHALEDCPEAALALDDLASADSYTYTHSIRVATLGLVLGLRITRLDGWIDWEGRRRYDDPVQRMAEMAMGLLIHDIGKIAIPEAVLNKPDALTPEEWELVRTHPSAGASLLPADKVSALTICIVRDHHERWDGLGYEQGRERDQAHQFARIAAVADVYDAVTADRPYKRANPPHVGVKVIREGSGNQFDPDVVAHFLRIAMPYPVGHAVTLPDGSTGVVARVDPTCPEHPVIRRRDGAGRLHEETLHIVDGVVAGEPAAVL